MFEIPAGIVALESIWNPALGKPFKAVIDAMAKIDGHRVDFGCALQGGAFNVTYEPGKPHTLAQCASHVSLVTFFWQFVARLQSQGTAPAIEVPEYFKALA